MFFGDRSTFAIEAIDGSLEPLDFTYGNGDHAFTRMAASLRFWVDGQPFAREAESTTLPMCRRNTLELLREYRTLTHADGDRMTGRELIDELFFFVYPPRNSVPIRSRFADPGASSLVDLIVSKTHVSQVLFDACNDTAAVVSLFLSPNRVRIVAFDFDDTWAETTLSDDQFESALNSFASWCEQFV